MTRYKTKPYLMAAIAALAAAMAACQQAPATPNTNPSNTSGGPDLRSTTFTLDSSKAQIAYQTVSGTLITSARWEFALTVGENSHVQGAYQPPNSNGWVDLPRNISASVASVTVHTEMTLSYLPSASKLYFVVTPTAVTGAARSFWDAFWRELTPTLHGSKLKIAVLE